MPDRHRDLFDVCPLMRRAGGHVPDVSAGDCPWGRPCPFPFLSRHAVHLHFPLHVCVSLQIQFSINIFSKIHKYCTHFFGAKLPHSSRVRVGGSSSNCRGPKGNWDAMYLIGIICQSIQCQTVFPSAMRVVHAVESYPSPPFQLGFTAGSPFLITTRWRNQLKCPQPPSSGRVSQKSKPR